MLSNLSSNPPCPGIILPKSLTLYCLFIIEAVKSPIIPAIDVKIDIIIRIKILIFILLAKNVTYI